MSGMEHEKQERRNHLLIFLGLVVAVLIVYGQVWDFSFTSYDDGQFVDQAMVRQGITPASILWACTSIINGAWLPVTWLSYIVDFQLFGEWAGGYHLVNVLIHLANSLLLYFLLFRLTRAQGKSGLVAGLFALHPLHVESVAWIAERRDVLSCFWELLAILAYTRWTRLRGLGHYLVVVICFVASLAAKPMAVTLPVVLFLLDFWPLKRALSECGKHPQSERNMLIRRLVEKAPLLLIALLISALTVFAEDMQGVIGSLEQYPMLFRVANALLSYCRYLGLMVWPVGLHPHYPYPDSIAPLTVLWTAGFLGMVSFFCFRAWKSSPYLVVGWLWYLVTLLPVIGFIQQGEFGMADRYTYFPLIGIFIMIAWGGDDLARRLNLAGRGKTVLALAVLIVLAGCCYRQVGFWRDTPTLFSYTLTVAPANKIALSQMGVYYRDRGQLTAAVPYLEKARKLYPDDFDARANLGQLYDWQGRFQEALIELDAAYRIIPERTDVLVNMGIIRARQGDLTGAERDLIKALQSDPAYLDARYNLALVHFQQGRLDLAEQELAGIIRTSPGDAEAYNSLGIVLLAQGRKDEAVAAFREAIRLNNALQDARNNLQDALGDGSRNDRLP